MDHRFRSCVRRCSIQHRRVPARLGRRKVRALLDKLRAEGYCFVKWWDVAQLLREEFSVVWDIDPPSLDRYVFEWMQEEQGL